MHGDTRGADAPAVATLAITDVSAATTPNTIQRTGTRETVPATDLQHRLTKSAWRLAIYDAADRLVGYPQEILGASDSGTNRRRNESVPARTRNDLECRLVGRGQPSDKRDDALVARRSGRHGNGANTSTINDAADPASCAVSLLERIR